MADAFRPIAEFLVNVGLVDVILPFMFVFTILFAVLQKSNVFGKYGKQPKSNINAMFAFVVAFFFIASLARVELLTVIVQKLALILVACISVLLITGLWGGNVRFSKYKWFMATAFIVVILMFGTALDWFALSDLKLIGVWLFHPITVFAFFFIGVIWFIVREPKSKSDKKPEKKDDKKKSEKKPPKDDFSYTPELAAEVPGEYLQRP